MKLSCITRFVFKELAKRSRVVYYYLSRTSSSFHDIALFDARFFNWKASFRRDRKMQQPSDEANCLQDKIPEPSVKIGISLTYRKTAGRRKQIISRILLVSRFRYRREQNAVRSIHCGFSIWKAGRHNMLAIMQKSGLSERNKICNIKINQTVLAKINKNPRILAFSPITS